MERFEFIRFARKERWMVLMLADDPLAEHESVTAKELEGLPLILPRRLKSNSSRSDIESWINGLGLEISAN